MTTSAIRTKPERSGWEAFGIFCAGVALIVLNVVAFAFVVVKLWAWFLVPAFGFPELTIPTAIGIDLIYHAINPAPPSKDDDRDVSDVLLKGLGRTIGICGLLLFMGYIAHRFV